MGDLNVPQREAEALKAIDTDMLRDLIDQCIREGQSSAVRTLRLDACGPYVASRLRQFESELSALQKAKSAKKRAEAEYDVRRAGGNLTDAVHQMKDRVATEERERQLFYVDDHVIPPSTFSGRLTVRISYQWRASVADSWTFGSIVFSHHVVSHPHYLQPVPARKPSAAKLERDRQEDLYRQWDYLKALGLQSIRDHFRQGGCAAGIPQTFQAKVDSHTQGLNNFSAQF
ncbi:hypothetical protein [Variovorax sp.]|jgi:hypothetical protein|uniref:hypothetical protein n=1 Tax=Variovorax sp. TaxID=1871043 RepID=UPI001ACCF3EA|nr:hypothetical protein [Burkholderiales bacterium]